jgi:hypothetical protein
MTTFPTLTPNAINFDLGQSNVSEVETFAGPIRFRHSGRINGHEVQITYVGLNQADVDALRDHYFLSQGTHNTFQVPAAIWGNLSVVAPNSVYRYLGPPQEEHTGLHYNVSLSLRVTDGFDLVSILNCGAALQPAVAPFTSFAFTGNAPFILNAGGDSPTYVLQGRGASQ